MSANAPEDAFAPAPDLPAIERRWRHHWEAAGIYRYGPTTDRPVFSVDTPPPYVSAAHLHVGHAMSYAQAEFIVRYRRMRGDSIFYPIGFDDNGLPTERFVERVHGIDKRSTSRTAFRELCLAETAAVSQVYEDLWRALGLSLDWRLRYSTIDDHCRRTAQLAFIRLHQAGRVYRADDPVFWDPSLGTALAQADLETVERRAARYDIAFQPDGSDASAKRDADDGLVISTTRPELLAGCVALYAHRDDARYRHLIGLQARVPLFGHTVPILADGDVDPAYGTGLMMVCTFGDADDVQRWRRDQLTTRLTIDEESRLTGLAGRWAGLTTTEGRAAIVDALTEIGALRGRHLVTQRVAVSERSGTPVEFALRPQWFLRLLDLSESLRARVQELDWHPEWMQRRLIDSIDGLRYDWNLSRQRHYGVPVPAWLCPKCGHAHLPDAAALPVDPLEDPPPGPCPHCGTALAGDPDVLDTWMTSSLTPQILTNWAGTPGRLALDGLPLSMRVQAHDIIRTWLFYTLVQSHLHEGGLPWRHVMISGWGLTEQGKRISKRDLDPSRPERFRAYDPHSVIAAHGADAVRHWAARAGLGQDVRYSERDVRAGRKVVLKLWNVARLCQPHLRPRTERNPAAGATAAPTEDAWILGVVDRTIATATAAFDAYDYAGARQATDDLLWTVADDWLELAKHRIWFPDRHPPAALDAAGLTMHRVLRALLGLYAPFLPFVTEELYQRLFAGEEGADSIHLTGWPEPSATAVNPDDIDLVLAVLRAARALRTERRWRAADEVAALVVSTDDRDLRARLAAVEPSLLAAARARGVAYKSGGGRPPGTATDVPGLVIDLRPA